MTHHCHHLKQVFSFVFLFHFPPSLLLKHEFFSGFCFCLWSMWKKQQEAIVEEEWWRSSCKGWITHVSHSICPPFYFIWQEGNIDSHCLPFYGCKTQRKKWWHHHHHFFLVLFFVFSQFLAINRALSSPHFILILCYYYQANSKSTPPLPPFFSWFLIVIIKGALNSLPFSFHLCCCCQRTHSKIWLFFFFQNCLLPFSFFNCLLLGEFKVPPFFVFLMMNSLGNFFIGEDPPYFCQGKKRKEKVNEKELRRKIKWIKSCFRMAFWKKPNH